MTSLPISDHLAAALGGVAAERLLVAFSGGLDSTVLLHALAQLKPARPLLAIHVHHGLSAYADQWADHCQQVCTQLNVTLHICRVQVAVAGRGLEDAARHARYEAFESLLLTGDVLLLAHHRDDQAETLLLRLMRGAGPKGLAAMAAERPLGMGRLWRPLLDVGRDDLHAYAQRQQLCWIDDDSNSDERLDRNYLRHQVMPLLAARWPEFSRQWMVSASLCRSQEQLTCELISADLVALDPQIDQAGASIDLARLRVLALARRQLLLRRWCETLGAPTPSRAQLEQIEAQLVAHRQDSEAEVQWSSVRMRCFRQRLYLFCPAPIAADFVYELNVVTKAMLPARVRLRDGAWLTAEAADDGLGLAPGSYSVRYRVGGERCKPAGRSHSQSLKKLLQEHNVAPWLRERIPLLYRGDSIAAVGDLWVCADFTAATGGLALRWDAHLSPISTLSV